MGGRKLTSSRRKDAAEAPVPEPGQRPDNWRWRISLTQAWFALPCNNTRCASLPKLLSTDFHSARCCLKMFHTSTRIFSSELNGTPAGKKPGRMPANDPGGKILLRGLSGDVYGIGILSQFRHQTSITGNQPETAAGPSVIGFVYTFNAICQETFILLRKEP